MRRPLQIDLVEELLDLGRVNVGFSYQRQVAAVEDVELRVGNQPGNDLALHAGMSRSSLPDITSVGALMRGRSGMLVQPEPGS